MFLEALVMVETRFIDTTKYSNVIFPKKHYNIHKNIKIPEAEDVSSLLFCLELSSYTIIGRPTSLLTESLLPE